MASTHVPQDRKADTCPVASLQGSTRTRYALGGGHPPTAKKAITEGKKPKKDRGSENRLGPRLNFAKNELRTRRGKSGGGGGRIGSKDKKSPLQVGEVRYIYFNGVAMEHISDAPFVGQLLVCCK